MNGASPDPQNCNSEGFGEYYVKLNSYASIAPNSPEAIKTALQNYGPVAAYIQDTESTFVLNAYTGGVITSNCKSENP